MRYKAEVKQTMKYKNVMDSMKYRADTKGIKI